MAPVEQRLAARWAGDHGLALLDRSELPVPAVGHQVDVVQRFLARMPGLIADLDAAQPLHPGHALDARHHEPQRVTVLGPEHLAVHSPGDNGVVQGTFHRDGAGQTRAVRAFGEHVAALFRVGTAVVQQRGEAYAGEFAAREHAVRVLDRGHGDVVPLHSRICAALDEVDARYGGQAHQVVHRVDLGLPDQAHQHQAMLARIDIPPALVVALEVQSARRDDAEHALQRRERDRGLRDARESRAFAALQVLFVFGRQSVGACRHGLAETAGVRGKLEDRWIALRARARRGKGRGAAAGDRQGLLEESPAVLECGKNSAGADGGARHLAARMAGRVIGRLRRHVSWPPAAA